jgi:glycosyltransferase involved in cell wall biosynthesis
MEAGLIGIPIISREVPAAQELAKTEALIFTPDSNAEKVAEQIIELLEESPTAHLRRRVRQDYTWSALFEAKIQPLLGDKE